MSGRGRDAPGTDVWEAVAAPGTDPAALAHVVALAHDRSGRAALRSGVDAVAAATVPAHARTSADDAAARWRAVGVRVALPGDPGWPDRLDRLADPPTMLAALGPVPDGQRPAVAIVGSRRGTPYGTGVAAWLAEAATAAGAVVVSGGAVGIDAAAHRAASAGRTAVVLGCGHGVPYPREHARPGGLFDAVVASGGSVLSEQLPGVEPRPWVVRARNRLVAALADVVVVVEGGDRSGSLLTATAAAEVGVEVLAVPGDVRAPGSVAPHRLLREGATPCTCPDDVLSALAAARPLPPPASPVAGRAASPVGVDPGRPGVGAATVLPDELHRVLAQRWPRPVHVGVLAEEAGVAVGAVLAAVTRGVVAGELAESATGVRLRRAP